MTTSPSGERPVIQLPELNPPPAFAAVCPFIYRSGDPTSNPKSFAFLDMLHLKTMVLLSIEAPAGKRGTHTHTPFLSPHEVNSFSVLESIVKDSLEILLDARNYPALILDTAGIFETGTLVGCLRKMQGWNFASILVEYRSFAGSRARSANERFIEMFDTDLVTLPPEEYLPDWLLPTEKFYIDERELSESQSTTSSE
ncbi:protein-tyrosine-phosphatase [Malassezia cuniculi]|uniref:Protein-tyrosine-phosphatase n=1 Tax=Malassezia cuniculi TaxID=948313 RepID=A0AAF0ERD4_9BASI|nr:protein-tyrosine-phosphatase [Malassezia cuniculi]